MPKKADKRPSFANEFKRLYNSTGNNINEIARMYDISPSEARTWLNKINQRDYSFIEPSQVDQFRENRAQSEKFFVGPDSMDQLYERTGPNYHMVDYLVEAGKSLPSNENTDNAQMYQLIIMGRERGRSSKRTTSLAGDLGTLFSMASAMMRQYGSFSGEEIIVRVFSPAEEE